MSFASPPAQAGQLFRNGTASAGGLAAFLLEDFTNSSTKYITVAAVSALFFFFQWAMSPKMDAREPPLIKAAIPFFGHIINLMTQHGHFYRKLYKKNKDFPIGTIAMGPKKMYIINSPPLVQAALKNKSLGIEPFVLEFAKKSAGVTEEVFARARDPKFLPEFYQKLHVSFAHEHVLDMNKVALRDIAETLNGIGPPGSPTSVKVDNLYLYIRDLMTLATTEALYGKNNPFRGKQDLLDDIWELEAGLLNIMVSPFPNLTVAGAVKARTRIQEALCSYYIPGHDRSPDTSNPIRVRAAAFREWGFPVEHIGLLETSMVHVSTVNSIPTTFWFVTQVLSRPGLVERVREEVSMALEFTKGENGKRIATINVTKLESNTTMMACYREVIRIANAQVGTRRVTADTMLSDGKGNTYLLKEGNDVQMPAGIAHSLPDIWGPDVEDFSEGRFTQLVGQASLSEAERRKKAAYIPFGGGKHLCPGRKFADAENLGFVAALVLGYDVKNGEGSGPVDVPKGEPALLVASVAKPEDGGKSVSASISRKKGWEDVEWRFTV